MLGVFFFAMVGFVKIFRSLKDWEWYDDHNATRLLVHLLLSVNYENKKWKGIDIPKGAMVFSWDTISKEVGLTPMQCRTSMTKLESSGEVTRKVTNKYQLVSLVKWEKFQIIEGCLTDKLTDEQQTNNRQITTTKEYKEINNNNSVNNESEIIALYDRFLKEIENGEHKIVLERIKMQLKLESLKSLSNQFNTHLLAENILHISTQKFLAHFKNWLNSMDAKGRLEEYKTIRRGAL